MTGKEIPFTESDLSIMVLVIPGHVGTMGLGRMSASGSLLRITSKGWIVSLIITVNVMPVLQNILFVIDNQVSRETPIWEKSDCQH